jgi:DnaJ family protein C protein 7
VRDFEMAATKEPDNKEHRKSANDAKKRAKQAAKKDYYKILGVTRSANDSEIKRSYRKLALEFHPDKNNDSEEQRKVAEAKFKDVSEAYTVLSDAQKRRKYDAGGDDDEMDYGGGGVDMNELFARMFARRGGMGGFGGGGGGGGRPSPFGGFHSQYGGGGGGGGYYQEEDDDDNGYY